MIKREKKNAVKKLQLVAGLSILQLTNNKAHQHRINKENINN